MKIFVIQHNKLVCRTPQNNIGTFGRNLTRTLLLLAVNLTITSVPLAVNLTITLVPLGENLT